MTTRPLPDQGICNPAAPHQYRPQSTGRLGGRVRALATFLQISVSKVGTTFENITLLIYSFKMVKKFEQ
jgi:hypothetical protein